MLVLWLKFSTNRSKSDEFDQWPQVGGQQVVQQRPPPPRGQQQQQVIRQATAPGQVDDNSIEAKSKTKNIR